MAFVLHCKMAGNPNWALKHIRQILDNKYDKKSKLSNLDTFLNELLYF